MSILVSYMYPDQLQPEFHRALYQLLVAVEQRHPQEHLDGYAKRIRALADHAFSKESTTVEVEVADLRALSDLIADRDDRKLPPTIENISACHQLIIKMLCEHEHEVYAPEDGS